ncbi:MAG: UDP-N-acetylmuramoyl-L-alanine--D-glutamate ligase, partial [Syntrophomonadaceae bacterium]|nr:UDP-N-acetylmuramoyl-L-alanine--D-glutamate ligase [Syntrophomonadaceae bacterium]
MNFSGKKVLVIGMARSGVAAAQVLSKKGALVTASDIKTPDLMQDTIEQLMRSKIEVWAGSYPEIKKESFDLVVVSPGVPLDIEPVQRAYNLDLPVIGEVELAYLLKKPQLEMYGITGTNGKTTTTALLKEILVRDGQKSASGGNIGTPLTFLVDSMDEGVIAVEVSSFQLETVKEFKPHICSILNITPDHLDRHKTMEAYIQAKTKIFVNQDADDFTILNYEDEVLRSCSALTKAKTIFFSTDRVLDEGVFVKDGFISARINNKTIDICNVSEVSLRGKHNLENILCATAMALAANVKPENIASVLKTFKGVRHRMEEVLIHNGVTYINDSKATNPESAIKALESFDQPIILIAGGRNKG